jgi:cellobiose phosphorylase
LRRGEFLGGGHGREERIRVRNTRTRAYREEDWAKLFKPEAMKKEELKEYLNDDPIWLWVFKSWHRFVQPSLSARI